MAVGGVRHGAHGHTLRAGHRPQDGAERFGVCEGVDAGETDGGHGLVSHFISWPAQARRLPTPLR